MLMRDEFFGHRHPLTGSPIGDKEEWIAWDFALVNAFHTAEAFTDQNGINQWTKEDPNAAIGAMKKIDEFQGSVESITSGSKYKKTPGEYFVPDIKEISRGEGLWTFADWREAERKKALENSGLVE